MKLKILVLSMLVGFAVGAYAQDEIHITNGKETLRCKVLMIGDDEIQYSQIENGISVQKTIDKEDVDHIVYADGMVKSINPQITEDAYYANDKRNAFKIDVISLCTNAPTFFYERSLSPSQSFEIGLGGVSDELGTCDYYDNCVQNSIAGMVARVGFKFKTTPSMYTVLDRHRQLLNGGYLKPELSFVYCNYQNKETLKTIQNKYTVMLAFNGGYQWVWGDFVLDLFGGLGYAVGDECSYAIFTNRDRFSIGYTFGVKLGFVYGKSGKTIQ